MRTMALLACLLFVIISLLNVSDAATLPPTAKLQDLADGAKTKGQQYQLDKATIPNAEKIKASPHYGEAKKSYDVVTSPEYQEKIEYYTEQLKDGVFAPAGKAMGDSFYSDLKAAKNGRKESPLAKDERIYILISSSVPVETLRTYAEDIAALGDENIRMVVRGFIGGAEKIAPTMNFFGSILHKDHQACLDSLPAGKACDSHEAIIDIDPNLFRRYKPVAVPAIVYVKGVHPNMPEASEGSEDVVGPVEDKNVMVIYGDPSLSYAMETFAREGGGKKLQAAADRIRRQ